MVKKNRRMNAIMLRNRIFYTFKPIIPRRTQIFIRRQIASYKRKKYASIWPIDPSSNKPPKDWQGWPDGKKCAFVLSHDVDTQKGHERVSRLAEIEMAKGFRSSFNFVPERYTVSKSLLDDLRNKGFQICVHGFNHDGKLFFSRNIFNQRAVRINDYLAKWGVESFTSPSMHHNKDWLHDLKITHSISTFDTDPFEPQPDGAGTVFPFWVQNGSKPEEGYLELPYTLPQDHLLYIILQEKNIDIWKQKVDWIVQNGGLVLLNTHSDYMSFDPGVIGREEYPIDYYTDLLDYIQNTYKDQYWHALPRDIARFWQTYRKIGIRRQESGDRRQESGDRRQGQNDRRQAPGNRRQVSENRRQVSGDRRRKKANKVD